MAGGCCCGHGVHRAGSGERDPEVRAWLDIADNAADEAVRKEQYRRAIGRIMEQACWVPLHTFVTNGAYTADLEFRTCKDEIPRCRAYRSK